MTFLSKIADYFRGDYEISCYSYPEIASYYEKVGEAAERGPYVKRSNMQEQSKSHGIQHGRVQSIRYPQTHTKTNKLLQYMSGEMDILCFAPTPEDYSSASMCTTVEGLVQNATDDEDDDMIYVDIGSKSHTKEGFKKSTNATDGSKIYMSKDSSFDNHRATNNVASTQKYSATDHHHKLSLSHSSSIMNDTQKSTSNGWSPNSYHNGIVKVSPQKYSPIHHLYDMSSLSKQSFIHNQISLGNNVKKVSFEDNRHVIEINTDRPSPTNVMAAVASTPNSNIHVKTPSAFTHIDAAGSLFLKAFYDRDNEKLMGNLLDSDEADLKVVEKQVVREQTFDFESAGFSPEEALMIKRRLKLQSLVRSLNSSLSE